MTFHVIDTKTGKEPDLQAIALNEEWAKDLMYCDMDQFAINEDGNLLLLDECGQFVYCPYDRFQIVFDDINCAEWVKVWSNGINTRVKCSCCGHLELNRFDPMNYCPNCGAKMKMEDSNDGMDKR